MSAPVPENATRVVADRSSLRGVVDALGDRVRINRGDQLYARCPVPRHEDRNPSLSVTWKVDRRTGGGRTLVHCQRDCEPSEVVDALGLTLSDLYDTPPARPADDRGSRWAPAPRVRKPKSRPGKSASSTGHGPRPEPVAVYTYTDADGVRVFAVERYEVTDDWPQKFGAVSFDRAGSRIVARKAPAAERRVLYRLPEVAAAVEVGGTVYVVEGEKDADAVAAAGAAATCNPFGACDTPARASKNWLPQYTRALAGAHVVIVADRDDPGYRHALHVAGELAGVAASVRLVEAAEGKDTADHLSAGHGLDELVTLDPDELRGRIEAHDAPDVSTEPVPAGPPVPAAEDAATIDLGSERRRRRGDDGGSGSGGDGSGGGADGEGWRRVVVRDHFEATDEGLFKLKYEQATETVVAQELLPVRVRLAARVREDLADGADPELTHVDLTADQAGEEVTLCGVDRKRWESCAWATELPWPAPFTDTQTGRSTLRNAIVRTSGPVPMTTMYGALGWQHIAGRWVYVHAGGALDGAGPVDGLRVHVPAPLQPFMLPTPPATAESLRAAVDASTTVLDVLPARIAAPLLGAAYRACLGYSRVTVMPVGPRSGGKTGLAALAAQHYAPTARHDAMPGAGAGEAAGTGPGLEELRYRGGDMLLPLDDLAPDRGTERASARGAEIARSQYNRTGKVRMTRDGGLRPMHPPRSLAMVTGEETTTVESAESRIVSLRVARGDVDTGYALPLLDQGDEPELRARLTAAMVAHYAPAMPLTEWLICTRQDLRGALVDPDTSDAGLDVRHSESVADLAVGWRAMLDMATARGAMTEDEAAERWARVWAGLVECKRHLMAGSAQRTPADRVRELLSALLVTGEVTICSRDGGTPGQPERYGWQRIDAGGADKAPWWREVGPRVGWAEGDTVWLHPGAVFGRLERQAKAEGEPLTYTRQGLGAALADAGVIRTRTRGGVRESTVLVRLGAERRPVKVWELDAGWLFPHDDGDDDDKGDGDPEPCPPAPPAPADGRPAEPDNASFTLSRSPAEGTDTGGRPATSPQVTAGQAADAPPCTPGETQRATESSQEPAGALSEGEAPVRPHSADSGPQSRPGRRSRRRGSAPTTRQYAGVAAVCEAKAGWLARPSADPAALEMPAGADLAGVLAWMDSLDLGHVDGRGKYRGAQHGYGQLWLLPSLRRALKLPASMPRTERGEKEPAAARRVRAAVEAAGWQVSASGRVGPWMVVWREGRPRYHVVVPEWLDEESSLGERSTDAHGLARRLGLFAHRYGVSYLWSPAVTGVRLMTTTRPRLLDRERPELPTPARKGDIAEGDFHAHRLPEPDERECEWLDAWDFNALYVGAASSLPLPWGGYRHQTSPEVDLTRPGLWRVELPKWEDARLPDPFGPARVGGRRPWVTTPTLKIADALGLELRPSEAWLSVDSARILDAWAGETRDARAALRADGDAPDVAAVLAAVKGAYAGAVGRLDMQTMRNAGHPMWRPDIRAHVIAQARFAVMHRILQAAEAGTWPLAVAVDAVAYPTNKPLTSAAAPLGFRVGDGLGQVKHLGRVRLADVAHLLTPGATPGEGEPGLMDRIKAGERL